MAPGRTFGLLVATLGLALPVALGSLPAAAADGPAQPYDLTGDGLLELVIGAPGLTVRGHERAGGVAVDSPAGPERTALVTQSSRKVAGASEDDDQFGAVVASADFDADGYADLAVGLPGEDFVKAPGAGAVTILYGGRDTILGGRSKQLAQPDGKHAYAAFGSALAVGDLNGDAYPDLAIGAPDDDPGDPRASDHPASGTVTVLYGSRKGLTTSGSTLLRGMRESPQDERFGAVLGTGDVDADGQADLLVGAQGFVGEDGNSYPGTVSVCAGATAGPTGCRRLLRSRDLQGARALVVGNVQGDQRAEVVVGVPSGDLDLDAGHLVVCTLAGTGKATTAVPKRYDQDDLGVPGGSGPTQGAGDDFGWALAIGRVGADAYDDLVVGAPGEAVGSEEAGRVVLVHGGAGGLATTGNTAYDQDTAGIPGGSEDGDRFGESVTLLDRDADGHADLAVGAPGEDDHAGRVTTLRGTSTGLTTADADTFGLGVFSETDRYQAELGVSIGR